MTDVLVKPRLGFLGVGWIGRKRMESLARADIADIGAIADAASDVAADAASSVGCTRACTTLDELLDQDLDGVVIATPSALHADHTIAALDRGMGVFVQKPLARTEQETNTVIDAAERADKLLGVDLAYRHLRAVEVVRRLVASGALGHVYAVDLEFHNAYGPDKPWFTDPVLSGGGCVIDLGTHLIDLALWILDEPEVDAIHARLFHRGRELSRIDDAVEDFATAELSVPDRTIRIACSWFVSAGLDARISATFFGTDGAARIHNTEGSFYDFRSLLFRGRTQQVLVEPPDDWGGRAITAWARRLGAGECFDPSIRSTATVARAIDRIYGRSG